MKVASIIAALVVLIDGNVSSAQGVGPGSPIDSSHDLAPIAQIPVDPPLWRAYVGQPSDPLSVSLDAEGPTWMKHFHAVDWFIPIMSGGNPILSENLIVAGERPWTGWRAYVANPDLEWVVGGYSGTIDGGTSLLVNGQPISGVTIESSPADPLPGSWLDFSFSSLAPGTELMFTIQMEYHGAEPLRDFSVVQFPVPEPGSALLLGSGAVLLSLPRRLKTGRISVHRRAHELGSKKVSG